MATETEIDEALLLRQVITQLQEICDAQTAQINGYYHEELRLRGDKIMMREYCQFFNITP